METEIVTKLEIPKRWKQIQEYSALLEQAQALSDDQALRIRGMSGSELNALKYFLEKCKANFKVISRKSDSGFDVYLCKWK